VSRRVRPALAAAATVVLPVAAAGCGFGPGPGTTSVTLTVTRGFGSERIGAIAVAHVPGSETVMRMLERRFAVTTRYGGGYVQSIDGRVGNGSARHDWFYYVNGIEAPQGAASTAVHRGDHVWWDLHDWSATNTIPAVVGSFPEPFVNGIGGKRLPTTLECASDVSAACSRISKALNGAGIPFASQYIGTGSGSDTLGIVVGTWSDVRAEVAAGLIANGPSASGVYARFAGNGRALQLLDPHGQTVRTLGPGGGLVAATADSQSKPTWLVIGTDPAGVTAAANAFTPSRLHDHFALAVQGRTDLPVPLQGNS
jgi:Domain of unknown function (DUF4430)